MPPRNLQLKHIRLVTFDAFGTLFTPRKPISKQYGEVARQYGLQGFSDDDISISFREGEHGTRSTERESTKPGVPGQDCLALRARPEATMS